MKKLKSLHLKNFCELFMQIVFALKVANDECDFCHYDLHPKNILVRKTDNGPFYIKYPVNGRDFYIKSSNGDIATIIDYGTSYIKYPFNKETREEKSMGHPEDMRKYAIYANSSYIISDVFKLLCSSLDYIGETRFYKTRRFLEFFTTERIIYGAQNGFIETNRSTFFLLPDDVAKMFDYNEFIEHCINIIRDVDTSIISVDIPDNIKVLKCGDYHCSSFENIIDEIIPQKNEYNIPNNFDDFIEIYFKHIDIKEIFEPNFDKVYQMEYDKLTKISDLVVNKFNQIKNSYNNIIVKKQFSDDDIDNIKVTCHDLVEIIKLRRDLQYQLDMIMYMFTIYTDKQFVDMSNNLKSINETLGPIITDNINYIIKTFLALISYRYLYIDSYYRSKLKSMLESIVDQA